LSGWTIFAVAGREEGDQGGGRGWKEIAEGKELKGRSWKEEGGRS
jgi:hypothetical protein